MTSLTIEDAESSFLKGKAEFEEWKMNFEMRWLMPQILDYLGTVVNTMPAESRTIAPEHTAIMEELYRKHRGG